ncbi:hypothetical protein DL766_009221 [Monosporascus sp. MC13-8B]|uniref:Uncharacterized protein n=1 Tax=Monosporascus cannonballus TaxID=155416 RepID=A0ABY0GV98_9PEZI|nr:hypothetical protein DL762_008748 [Monosporascus cannonballus]RYO97005.1 hypothetical protein DL763_002942 [Monosporascus cannonballus]RYP16141.1 hypothetical protein DL766_009221 [Monosporascus sp. MC13-8B]
MAWKRGRYAPRCASSTKETGVPGILMCDLLVYAGGSDAEKPRDCVLSASGLVAESEVKELGARPRYDDGSDPVIFEQPARSQIGRTDCVDIVSLPTPARERDLDRPSWAPYWLNHRAAGNDRMAWRTFPMRSNMRPSEERKAVQLRPKAEFRATRGARITYRRANHTLSSVGGNVSAVSKLSA